MNCPKCDTLLHDRHFDIMVGRLNVTVWLRCGCGYVSGRNLDAEDDFGEEYA